MYCAGTGLAPFRGFIEQRLVQIEANPSIKLAPAHLFIGCRGPTRDRLYGSEMDEWEKKGAVSLHYAFSKEPEKSMGCVHVSDRMLKEEDLIVEQWHNGARAYVCGNRAFLSDVTLATSRIFKDRIEQWKAQGEPDEVVRGRKASFLDAIKGRAADDIFD